MRGPRRPPFDPLLACLLLAVGCRARAAPASAATDFRDPEGRPVTIASLPARRIVSTMQSATEWLVLLGAESLLVARTDYDRQPELRSLPSIGGGLDVSAEVIAALTPDVVLGWRIRASADLQRALAPFGIPVIEVEATDTAQIFRQLGALGTLVGREARAAALADSVRGELAASAARCEGPPESAFLVLSTDPPMTVGHGAWMTQLMPAACLTSAFADAATPWPTISLEALTARQPRWIVTSLGQEDGARRAELAAMPGWRDLEAVQAGRILEIPGDLLTRAGPTIGAWVRAVDAARRAHADR